MACPARRVHLWSGPDEPEVWGPVTAVFRKSQPKVATGNTLVVGVGAWGIRDDGAPMDSLRHFVRRYHSLLPDMRVSGGGDRPPKEPQRQPVVRAWSTPRPPRCSQRGA